MRVCYFTHASNLTGASRSLLDLLDCHRENNVEPIVVVRQSGPLIRELERGNIPYKKIPYVTAIKGSVFRNCIKHIINWFALKQICIFLKKRHIEIVHNNSLFVPIGMEAANKLNIPYICHLRDFIEEDHDAALIDSQKQYYLVGRAAYTIAISEAIQNKYRKLVPDASIVQIYDGIRTESYINENNTIFQNEKVTLLLAGRIQPGKGQLEAIKAVEWLKYSGYENISLIIIGSVGAPKYARELNLYIRENKLSSCVNILHFAPDLSEIRYSCDIGLTCSRLEAMGRITIENMLAKLLIIGADTAGTAELVRDGETGLKYMQGDYRDLANKIIYAMEHREEMRAIAENGFKFAQGFRTEKQNKQVYELYSSICNTCI